MTDLLALVRDRHAAKRKRELEGVELLARRNALGLTQAALANRLGMHPNTVACMERGEKPISRRTWAQLRDLRIAT